MMVQLRKPDSRLFTIALVLIVLGIAGIILGVWRANALQAEPLTGLPNFTPVLPEGKSIDQLGGWQKLTPPQGGNSFYVYVDTVAGVSINVSQQVLPGKIKNNPTNEMNDLARAYNATTKFDAGDTKVYLGTSAKGPQSVIFTKNDLLILIKSWSEVSNADWVGYINSLE